MSAITETYNYVYIYLAH